MSTIWEYPYQLCRLHAHLCGRIRLWSVNTRPDRKCPPAIQTHGAYHNESHTSSRDHQRDVQSAVGHPHADPIAVLEADGAEALAKIVHLQKQNCAILKVNTHAVVPVLSVTSSSVSNALSFNATIKTKKCNKKSFKNTTCPYMHDARFATTLVR